jgi:enoyl-CoA hydratase
MADAGPADMVRSYGFQEWDRIRRVATPSVAAVSGFALGGGCELAMLCDIIVASETAQFGQPEIRLGVMPGAGGTQRLTRAVGKSRAMEMVLTGRPITAQEAYAAGLVSRVVPAEVCLDEAKALAREIASQPPIAVRMAKEAVLQAFETPLADGVLFERRCFHLLFGTEDAREGIRAFLEKRPPRWTGR